MIISIDQRLVTAAALVKETFTDKDAQDFYWDQALCVTARITEAAIAVRTVLKFLISFRTWLQGLNHEEIEQYQLALPAASTAKLLPAASDDIDPWDSEVKFLQPEPVLVEPCGAFLFTPQLLLAPAKELATPAPKPKGRRQGTKANTPARSKTRKKNATKELK